MSRYRGSFDGPKTHFKMYKKGRQWIFTGITVASVGLGMLGVATTSASADTTAPATDDTTVEPETVTPTKTAKQVTLSNDSTPIDAPAVTDDTTSSSSSSTSTTTTESTTGTNSESDTVTKQASENYEAVPTIAVQATAPTEDKQAGKTATDTNINTANLGDTTPTEIDTVKNTARAAYETTGIAQKVTSVAATTADELSYSATQTIADKYYDRNGNAIGFGDSTTSYDPSAVNAVNEILKTNSEISSHTPDQAGWGVDYANSTVNVTVDGVQTVYTIDDFLKKTVGFGLNAYNGYFEQLKQEAEQTITNETDPALKAIDNSKLIVAGNAIQDAYDKAVVPNSSLADRYDFLARVSYLKQPETLKVGGQVSDWETHYVLFNPSVTAKVIIETAIQDADGQNLSEQTGTTTVDLKVDADNKIVSTGTINYQDVTDTIPNDRILTGIAIIMKPNDNDNIITFMYDPLTDTGNILAKIVDSTTGETSTTDIQQESGSTYTTATVKMIMNKLITKTDNSYTVISPRMDNTDYISDKFVYPTTEYKVIYTVTSDKNLTLPYTTEVKTETGTLIDTQHAQNTYGVKVDTKDNILAVNSTNYQDVTDKLPAGYNLTGITMVANTGDGVITLTYDPVTRVGTYVITQTDPTTGETTVVDRATSEGSEATTALVKKVINTIITNSDNAYTISFKTITDETHLTQDNVSQIPSKMMITYNVTAQPTTAAVQYVDQSTGNVIATDQVTGKVDDTGTYTAVAPRNYTLTPDQAKVIDYTLTPDNGTIITVKVRAVALSDDSQGTTNMDVHYVDQAGHMIAPSTNQAGKVGSNFSVTAPTILGYVLVDPDQATVTGQYNGNQMDLTLIYSPVVTPSDGGKTGSITDPETTPGVTGETTDSGTNPITTPTTTPEITLTTEPTVPATPAPSTETSEATIAQQPEVKAESEQTMTTAQQAMAAENVTENAKQVLATKLFSKVTRAVHRTAVKQTTSARLPQTNETTAPITLIGMALLSLMSLLGLGVKKRRKD